MFTKQDISRFRAETAGTEKVIHLNNAGSALPPDVVRKSVLNYLEEEMTLGGYETHEKYYSEIEGVYTSLARLINAEPEQIAVLENATAAWHMAFFGIDFKDGDEILACQADYSSNFLSYLHLQEKVNVEVKVVPNDGYGQIDVEALDQMISPKTKLISLVHIPTNSGLVSPAEKVGEVARRHGILYLLDACQSAGQVPFDVQKIGCDMLSATGRKYLRAPRGTGFLYVSHKALEQIRPPFIDLHSAEWTAVHEYRFRSDARKFENWESNFAGVLGLKKAIDYINDIGMEPVWSRVQDLGHYLRKNLASLSKVSVLDEGKVLGGIVSFSVDNYRAEQVKRHLGEKGINVSWMGQPNARLDMETRGIHEIVRASAHYYNTEEEIDRLIVELGRL